jgi:hypothetical protein
MAEIKRYGLFRHLRSDAAAYVVYHRGARLIRCGRGLAFWFRPLSASLAELPADDREMSLVFHGRSADFQDVNVQGVLLYRVVDPEALAGRIDFSIDARTGQHLRQPIERIELTLGTLAQQHAADYVSAEPIRAVLARGPAVIRERIEQALVKDPGLQAMGLAVLSVRIGSIKPAADVERALEAPTREKIQEASDEAAFARRCRVPRTRAWPSSCGRRFPAPAPPRRSPPVWCRGARNSG